MSYCSIGKSEEVYPTIMYMFGGYDQIGHNGHSVRNEMICSKNILNNTDPFSVISQFDENLSKVTNKDHTTQLRTFVVNFSVDELNPDDPASIDIAYSAALKLIDLPEFKGRHVWACVQRDGKNKDCHGNIKINPDTGEPFVHGNVHIHIIASDADLKDQKAMDEKFVYFNTGRLQKAFDPICKETLESYGKAWISPKKAAQKKRAEKTRLLKEEAVRNGRSREDYDPTDAVPNGRMHWDAYNDNYSTVSMSEERDCKTYVMRNVARNAKTATSEQEFFENLEKAGITPDRDENGNPIKIKKGQKSYMFNLDVAYVQNTLNIPLVPPKSVNVNHGIFKVGTERLAKSHEEFSYDRINQRIYENSLMHDHVPVGDELNQADFDSICNNADAYAYTPASADEVRQMLSATAKPELKTIEFTVPDSIKEPEYTARTVRQRTETAKDARKTPESIKKSATQPAQTSYIKFRLETDTGYYENVANMLYGYAANEITDEEYTNFKQNHVHDILGIALMKSIFTDIWSKKNTNFLQMLMLSSLYNWIDNNRFDTTRGIEFYPEVERCKQLQREHDDEIAKQMQTVREVEAAKQAELERHAEEIKRKADANSGGESNSKSKAEPDFTKARPRPERPAMRPEETIRDMLDRQRAAQKPISGDDSMLPDVGTGGRNATTNGQNKNNPNDKSKENGGSMKK